MATHWPSDKEVAAASGDAIVLPSSTLFVRNLNFETTDDHLTKHFEDIGPLKRAFVAKEKGTKSSRGMGFVEFATVTDAKAALDKLNGKKLMGRPLILDFAANDKRDNTAKEEIDSIKKKIQEKKAEEKRLQNRQSRLVRKRIKDEVTKLASVNPDVKAAFQKTLDKPIKNVIPGQKRASTQGETNGAVSDPNNHATVVVSGLGESVQITSIQKVANKFGKVVRVVFPSPESLPGDFSSRITYASSDDAIRASKKFTQYTIEGCSLRCIMLTGNALAKAARLVVRNLPFSTTEEALARHFAGCGKVETAHIPVSSAGLSRGFGFVQFSTLSGAQNAVDTMSGTVIDGKEVAGARAKGIAVDWCLPKNDFTHRLQLLQQQQEQKQAQEEKQQKQQEQAEAETKMNDGSDSEEGESDSDSSSDSDDSDDDDSDDDNDNDDVLVDESGAEDEGDEDKDNEEDDDADDDDDESVPAKPETWDVSAGSTLFIRNLAYDTSSESLQRKFETFGKVRYAVVVSDKVTGRPMGTAFVNFADKAVADAVLARYGTDTSTQQGPGKKTSTVHSGDTIRLDGRELNIARAVDRTKAKQLQEDRLDDTKKQDKRNLYLAREGVILEGMAAAKELSKKELEKRERAWKEKREKLKNPNFRVSETRLSVRNIPPHWTEVDLRKLFRGTVVNDFKKAGKKVGDISLKQVKIVKDKEKKEADGTPKSKGYGFVEFLHHEHALHALRALNNHPTAFATSPSASTKSSTAAPVNKRQARPIVEFALDDARKLLVRERVQESGKRRADEVKAIKEKAAQEALSKLGNDGDGLDLASFVQGVVQKKEKELQGEKEKRKRDAQKDYGRSKDQVGGKRKRDEGEGDDADEKEKSKKKRKHNHE